MLHVPKGVSKHYQMTSCTQKPQTIVMVDDSTQSSKCA